MIQCITLKEGFIFTYKENKRTIDVLTLSYEDIDIARGWMEITDFVATLESGIRGKLGTKKRYKIGENTTVYGIFEKEFLVNIVLTQIHLQYDLVETQQLVSKVNKLLHLANKLYQSKIFEYKF